MLKKIIILFPVLSGIMWGSAGIFVRKLKEMGMDGYTVVSSRVIAAVLILCIGIVLYDRSLLKIKLKDTGLFAAGGLIGMFGLNMTYNAAIGELTLSLAAVLLSLSPVFVLIMAAILYHEKITKKKFGCMVLALSGCVLASGVLESASGMKWSVPGILFGCMGAFFYALYSIISKSAMAKGYHPVTVTFYCLVSIAIVLLPVTQWDVIGDIAAAAPVKNISFMILHSLCTSVLPYVLYTVSLNYLEAGKVSILAAGEPVAAMIFGAVFFAEQPTMLSIAGLFLTAAAMILLGRKEKEYPSSQKNVALNH